MEPVMLDEIDRAILQDLIFRRTPARALCRAQAILWLSDGGSVDEVAENLNVSVQTVYNWIRRFSERDGQDLISRVSDAPRSGRPALALGVIDPLIHSVIHQDPRKFGFHYATWTAPVLREYLRKDHGLDVSLTSVKLAIGRLPIRWKRPKHSRALKAEHAAQSKGGSKEA